METAKRESGWYQGPECQEEGRTPPDQARAGGHRERRPGPTHAHVAQATPQAPVCGHACPDGPDCA